MGLELEKALRDCGAAAERLLALLKEDQLDMPGCISGEILVEYQRGTEWALQSVRELREGLRVLQEME